MFNTEKSLLKKIFQNGAPAIKENADSLIKYANEVLILEEDEYLSSYPELRSLPIELILHALLWGFTEGRNSMTPVNASAFRSLQFFCNSFSGLNRAFFFDKEYIKNQAGEKNDQFGYIDAVFEYNERWLQGAPINPNRYFSSNYTASLYGTDIENRQTPATLFLLGAQISETFKNGGDFYKKILRSNSKAGPVKKSKNNAAKIYFLSHGAGRTGACLNAFYTAASLYDRGLDVIFFYVQGGDLEEEIRARIPAIKVDSPEHFAKILAESEFTQGVVNTITLGNYVAAARNIDIPTITLIHEWTTSIHSFGWSPSASAVAASSTKVICSSQRGRTDFLTAFPSCSAKTYVLPQGDYLGNEKSTQTLPPPIFSWLRARYTKIVIISGYFDTRKGFDLLPQLIVETNKLGTHKYCFVHIGETAPHLLQWIQSDLRKAGCEDQAYFLGKVTNPLEYFSHADAMALPSREDPLPTVVMEAINSGLPVVLFDKSTGFSQDDYVAEFEAGFINQANYMDIPNFAQKLCKVLENKPRKLDKSSFDFSEYIEELSIHILDIDSDSAKEDFHPNSSMDITAVAVFHNQAKYAWIRLLSIAEQSRPPKQLIIVDDASTDGLQKDLIQLIPVLKSRIQDVQFIRNDSANAGKNTIVNMHRILTRISHEWIWICEGDDFCTSDFLETSIPHLDDKVSLYYCDSMICNDDGFIVDNYDSYYDQLPTDQFKNSYRRRGRDETDDWLAIKNTIPNMSAAIVSKRRVQSLSIADYSSAFGCGDWRFYRDVLQEGDLVFNKNKMNCHRRHEKSVFGSDKNRVKNECELIEYQTAILNRNQTFPGLQDLIIQEMRNRPIVSAETEARKSFFLAKATKLRESNFVPAEKEGILIVVPDFGAGGGQLVAVDIANEYARRGDFRVYVCSARGYYGLSRTVLRRINPDIVILDSNDATKDRIESLNIRRIQSHVYWSDKFVFERGLHNVASWSISMHGCYNDFLSRATAYRDFVPLAEIGRWFEAADFIQVCAEKHFDAIQYFSPTSLPKSKLVWNGLNDDHGTEEPGQLDTLGPICHDDAVSHIVMTGRWEPSKGWQLLKDAYILLKSLGREDLGKCILIGPSMSELNGAWGDGWNQGDFIVTGELSQPVTAYGSLSLIGVLPSYFHSESQPRVVSEFFSKGIPVVTSEAGDLKQLVGSNDMAPGGITIPISGANHSPADLAAALIEVLDNHAQFSSAAKDRFNNRLNVRKSVEIIQELWFKQRLTAD